MFTPQPVTHYKCGNPTCNRRHFYVTPEEAENCCVCSTCGGIIDHAYQSSQCSKCRAIASAAREKSMLDNAQLVPYEGQVLHNTSEDFLYTEDDLYDYINDNFNSLDEIPEYMYVATKVSGISLDAYSTVEYAVEDRHYENAMDDIVCIDSLQRCLDIWCERQDLVSYHPDTHEKISVRDWITDNNITFDFEEVSKC